MQRTFDRWLLGATGLVALLVVATVLTIVNIWRLNGDAFWVAHTHEVMTALDNVLSLAKDAETGGRGYVITGEPRFLEPYNAAVADINEYVSDVERLTADNPSHQERIPELRKLISALLRQLDQLIALRKAGGFDAAQKAVLSDRGKAEMDALRVVVSEMIRHEQDLLRDRMAKRKHTFELALLTGVLSGVAAVAGVVAFMLLLRRHLAARTAAAAALAERSERLRTTLASIGDAVITTDTEGCITSMNAVAESLTGWKGNEAAGQPLDVVFRIVSEETHQSVPNSAMRALREGIIVGLANHTILISKDGAERPIDDSAAPIRHKEEKVLGCVLVFRDVTDRRKAEQKLRESEQRLSAELEAIKRLHALSTRLLSAGNLITALDDLLENAIVTSGADFGNIQLYNPQAGALEIVVQRGFRPEFLDYFRFVRVDEGSCCAQAMQSGQRIIIEDVELDPEYEPHRKIAAAAGYRAVQSTPLKSSHGNILGMLSTHFRLPQRVSNRNQRLIDLYARHAADLIERMQFEQTLREADRRKDEFLATLAHELRNPLAPIRNALSIINLAPDNPEALNRAREMMTRQVEQMVRLIDDLLDVSRISRGKLELRKERVELAPIINHAVETYRPVTECADQELTVTVPPQPVYLDADPIRLAQVIGNLLNNACKFTQDGGRIWLTAERQGSDVVVVVKDNGIGIPTDKVNSIFEMFSQVDRTLKKSHGGLGIGLTLVKRLAEMHEGSVEVRSEGLGKGSEFIVRLPVVIKPQPPPEEPEEEVRPSSTCRILVVDDNRDSAESLATVLKLSGNETHLAYDGEEAVEVASQVRPDMILLDIGLPKLNGYDACRRIREKPWGKKIPIIALTGWGQEDDRRKSTEAGFKGHLVKPVDHAALKKVLADSQAAK